MFVLKRREYPVNMNFVTYQSRSVNNDNMLVWWDLEPYFVVYANSLKPKFLLIHFVLFENIKQKLFEKIISTNNIFIYCFRIIVPVLCSWHTFMWEKITLIKNWTFFIPCRFFLLLFKYNFLTFWYARQHTFIWREGGRMENLYPENIFPAWHKSTFQN